MDTLYIKLPAPELCYFKLDLKQSQIYDLNLGYLSNEDKAKFMDDLYKKAEGELESAAIQSGIYEMTLANAEVVLKPLFEEVSGKSIVFLYPAIEGTRIEKL
jgi:hypothetical protein